MEEIKFILWTPPSNKSPRSDDIMTKIYKVHWDSIVEDVRIVALHFFMNKHVMKELNHTHPTLILKKQVAHMLSDYYPISCLGVMYMIIAKLLATQLARKCS